MRFSKCQETKFLMDRPADSAWVKYMANYGIQGYVVSSMHEKLDPVSEDTENFINIYKKRSKTRN